MSEGSVKKESVTDAGTNVRDGHSNMSVMSNLETEDMEDEEEDTHDQLSVDLHESSYNVVLFSSRSCPELNGQR